MKKLASILVLAGVLASNTVYVCSRCGSKGWIIGYDGGTIIKCPCCSAVWMENVVL